MNQDIEVAHNKLSCLKHFSKQKLLLTKTVKIEIHYDKKNKGARRYVKRKS